MKKQANQYTCVSCDFYDILEIFSMRKNQVKIVYRNLDRTETLITRIKTLVTRDKEEFMVTLSDMEIRLDKLLQVDTYPVSDTKLRYVIPGRLL